MTLIRITAILACMGIFSLAACSHGATNGVVINEFLAVNDTLSNAVGQCYDWIELYNNSSSNINMTGWHLTDNAGRLNKWTFPVTNINANGYLLVYASGSNGVIGGELHANFKLGSSGDYLGLVYPDGVTIAYEYAPTYPVQYSDISYGISWGTNGLEERYLSVPTPGAVNSNAFMTAEVTFSVPHGFYSNSFTVALSNNTSGAKIYYTTNSAEPTTNSALYGGAITIARTTVLRARAFKSGYDPSMINTRTYLFLNDIITSSYMNTGITQHPVYGPQMTNALLALPTISLVTETTNCVINWEPELKTSVELILPDGSEGFQVNAGVARFGNYITDFIKRQFRLYFRSEYGPSRLDYPLFKGFEHGIDAVRKFNQLDLHSGSHDMLWGFPMSGAWGDDTLLDMGNMNVHERFVHLYINGNYWGQYRLRERWNADMMAQYVGGEPEQYEAVEGDVWTRPATNYDGDGSAWARVVSLSTNYDAVKPYLDVSSLIDYMFVYCIGTSEPEYRAVGPVDAGAGFKFHMRDADNLLRLIGWPVTEIGPAGTYSNLYTEGDTDFNVLMADRIYASFFHEGAFTPDRCKARLTARCDETQVSFIAESARWTSIYPIFPPPAQWQTEKTRTLDNFNTAPASLLTKLRNAGMYPLDAPEYNRRGGMFTNTFILTITNAGGGTIYYTLDGGDPRQEVTGNAVGTQYSGAITLNRSTMAKARAKSGATWSALNEALFVLETPSTLRVTEIMYNPRDSAWGAGNSTNFEFVEFQNVGTQAIGLAGIELTSGVRFDFTEGRVPTLDPGEYVVLVSDLAAFTNRYTNWAGMNIAGTYQGQFFFPVGSLADEGENLTLLDGAGRTIQAFDYEDDWYPCTDGEGFSLTILDPAGNTNNWDTKIGWRYSAYVDGSPGEEDPDLLHELGSVVINEALTHQDTEPPGDWIELRNTTASPIDISDWYLSDNSVNLKMFQMPPSTVIPANGYVVFTESGNFGTNVLGTNGFALSEWGDAIYLSAGSGVALAQPAYRDSVDFEDAERDVTFGRYVKSDGVADFTAMNAPTTNTVNTYPKVGPVVISELMYSPASGQHEFIELANISGSTVPLYDPLHASNAWKVAGVNFTFPTNTTIGTSTVLLVQNTVTPEAFRASNGVPAGVQIFNYTGSLENAGERLSLKKPTEPDESGVPYVDIDVVKYNNRSPWPIEADGYGYSLERISLTLYGNDSTNWTVNTVGGTPGVVSPTFDSSSWSYGMKIRFSGYTRPETLMNFPALIVFNESLPGFDYAQFKAGGSDLRFTSDKGRELNYEIEKWNTNGDSVVWAQVPLLANSNAYIWAYWGNPSATAPAYATNGATWAHEYMGVWHLNETISSNLCPDSTSGRYHGTNVGPANIEGKLAGAKDFSGSNCITLPAAVFSTISSQVTISVWQYGTPPVTNNFLFDGESASRRELAVHLPWNGNVVFYAFGSESMSAPSGGSEVGQWNHWAFIRDGGTMRVYRNGNEFAGASGKTGTYTRIIYFNIGSSQYDGIIDEFRVSDIARSSNWIWACWANQYSNAAFNTCGAVSEIEDTGPHGVPESWLQSKGLTNYVDLAAAEIDDPDDDGMETWEEYYAGTEPTNGNSVFRILSFGKYGSTGWRIGWRSVTSRYYSVYKSTNILKGWLVTPLTSFYWGASSGTNILNDPSNTNAPSFYKITTTKP